MSIPGRVNSDGKQKPLRSWDQGHGGSWQKVWRGAGQKLDRAGVDRVCQVGGAVLFSVIPPRHIVPPGHPQNSQPLVPTACIFSPVFSADSDGQVLSPALLISLVCL